MPASTSSLTPARRHYPGPSTVAPVTARVRSVRRVRPGTVRVTLGLPRDRSATSALIRGVPGRYCTVLLPRVPAGPGPVRGDGVARHYTVRDARPELGEIDLDVVRHETAGPAGISVAMRWLSAVRAGDAVRVAPAGPGWSPRRGRHRLLYVADATALPAVCAQVERLASQDEATVVAEVTDACNEPDVVTCARVRSSYAYLGQRAPGDPFALLDALDAALRGWSSAVRSRTAAWVAGESATVTVLRSYLVQRHGLPAADVTARAYWRRDPPLLG